MNDATPMPAATAADPSASTGFRPKMPASLQEAGVPESLADALILKWVYTLGTLSSAQIAQKVALPLPIVVPRLEFLKKMEFLAFQGTADMGDFNYALTDRGRMRANMLNDENGYIGPAPVPLDQYINSVGEQTITKEKPDLAKLTIAFSDLLINDQMFDNLGPAINSGRGMFLYGFPGNGKTSIAERVTRCFGSNTFIPHAMHVEGTLIRLFDPAIHEALPKEETVSYVISEQVDPRWVQIKRPTVVVGGELTMESLELAYNPSTKVADASLQMKSNCGTLVIDDFGRQRMEPIELLNRWIVPLEKRYDFLTLPNGQKIQVPFDQLIIFSTNLEPKDLVDEAFLRRIPYKINAVDPSEDEFRKLFQIMCKSLDIEYDESALDYLIENQYKPTGRPFRCCQPRDLLLLIKNQCQYHDIPARMTPELLDFATGVYFTVL